MKMGEKWPKPRLKAFCPARPSHLRSNSRSCGSAGAVQSPLLRSSLPSQDLAPAEVFFASASIVGATCYAHLRNLGTSGSCLAPAHTQVRFSSPLLRLPQLQSILASASNLPHPRSRTYGQSHAGAITREALSFRSS